MPPSTAATKTAEPGQEPVKLEVWVPCAYAGAMTELSTMFEQQYPGLELRQRVENVAVLAPRILEGATPDVFMSIGDIEVKALEETDRVDYSMDFCFTTLALVTAKGNPAEIHSLADLAGDRVQKIGVGSEKISAGYYARKVLKEAGLWKDVEGKVVEATMPLRLLQWVGNGEVEASLAYAACLRSDKHKTPGGAATKLLEVVGEVDDELCLSIACPAVSVKGCPHPQEARQFIEFLTTDEAQKVIAQCGFLTLSEAKCYLPQP